MMDVLPIACAGTSCLNYFNKVLTEVQQLMRPLHEACALCIKYLREKSKLVLDRM